MTENVFIDVKNRSHVITAEVETADVGLDAATPVTEDYAQGDNAFTGRIERVTVELR